MAYRPAVLGIVALVFATALNGQAPRAEAPCGLDGRECQCGVNEWTFAYQDYHRTGEHPRVSITHGRTVRPSCRTREECAGRFRDFVTDQREAAEFNRRTAQSSLRQAREFERKGDQRWYRIAMDNHRWQTAQARVHDLRASSAVAPHCDLDKVRERLVAEFPAARPPNTGEDWVIPPVQSGNRVGVAGNVTLSERSAGALLEMSENWERAGALGALARVLPILDASKNWKSGSDAKIGVDWAGVILDLRFFDWDAWNTAISTLDKSLDPFVRNRNRDLCLYEYLYWSEPGRGRSSNAERNFWGMMCRSMQ